MKARLVRDSEVSPGRREERGRRRKRRQKPLNTRRRFFRLRSEIGSQAFLVTAVLSFAFVFFGWWGASAINLADDLFLPSPPQVWERAVQLFTDDVLVRDTRISFARISVGFLVSTFLAVPIGFSMACYRLAEAAFEPLIEFVRYMPAVAFVPLTIVWVGVGEDQKYLIIFIGTFFQQALMIMDNVKSVPNTYINIAYTLGMRDPGILFRVIARAAAPRMWDTIRITLGWAWTWLILAELVAASEGLGHRIMVAMRFFQTDTIFVGILVIGLIGLLMDQIVRLIGRRVFAWAQGSVE